MELELPEGATLRDALELAQAHHASLPAEARMQIDWPGAVIGVWGDVVTADAALRDGDRIEVYRPLSLDPKQGRRQRAQSRRS